MPKFLDIDRARRMPPKHPILFAQRGTQIGTVINDVIILVDKVL